MPKTDDRIFTVQVRTMDRWGTRANRAADALTSAVDAFDELRDLDPDNPADDVRRMTEDIRDKLRDLIFRVTEGEL